jgi:hypothetical protein
MMLMRRFVMLNMIVSMKIVIVFWRIGVPKFFIKFWDFCDRHFIDLLATTELRNVIFNSEQNKGNNP